MKLEEAEEELQLPTTCFNDDLVLLEGIKSAYGTIATSGSETAHPQPAKTEDRGSMMAETKEFISKGRLDALTDGVFAFAMALLVVNLDLPEDFHPQSAAELVSALLDLGGTFIA